MFSNFEVTEIKKIEDSQNWMMPQTKDISS